MERRQDPGNPILPLLILGAAFLVWDRFMGDGEYAVQALELYQWLNSPGLATTATQQSANNVSVATSALSQLATLGGVIIIVLIAIIFLRLVGTGIKRKEKEVAVEKVAKIEKGKAKAGLPRHPRHRTVTGLGNGEFME